MFERRDFLAGGGEALADAFGLGVVGDFEKLSIEGPPLFVELGDLAFEGFEAFVEVALIAAAEFGGVVGGAAGR
jgi:hypothetical protein